MNKVKISAKSIDEARTEAMIKLGISSDRLEYTVLSEAKKGFLGIGAKQAVIEAWAKEDKVSEELDVFMNTSAKEQVSRMDETPAAKKEEKPVQKPAKKKENKEPAQENKPAAKPERKNKAKDSVEQPQERKAKKPEKFEKAPKAEKPAKVETINRPETPAKNIVDKPVEKVDNTAKTVDNAVDSVQAQPAQDKPKLKLEDVKDTPEAFITKVCNAMGIDVQLETRFDDKDNVLDINMLGDDMGILIGKRGQTLDSLQYLTGLVVNKEQGDYIRVKLDTENYRERRKETLENLAKNIAHKVTKTRKAVDLEPMNPYERRVIHAALQNDKYVCTRSEGEEPFRHVVVSMKKDAPVGGGRNNRGGKKFDRNRNHNQNNKNKRNGYNNRRREGSRDRKPAANTSEVQNTES